MDDVKGLYRRERLLALAEAEGLGRMGKRIQCPAKCSDDPRGASVTDKDNGAVYYCQHCKAGGSALDLVMATRGLDLREAKTHLLEQANALPVEAVRPEIKHDARQLWSTTTDNDPAGLAYLKGRMLDGAVGELVRFNVGRTDDGWWNAKAAGGYRVALALRNAKGEVVQVQMRGIRDAMKPRQMCLPGGYPERACFGRPDLAAQAAAVHLAEGMADTMAVTLVTKGVVLGAPGVDQVKHLLGLVGKPEGRTFHLYPQRDKPGTPEKPKLTSLEAFTALAEALEDKGGVADIHLTPEGVKDPADWLKLDRLVMERLLRGETQPPAPEKPRLSVVPAETDGSAARRVEPRLKSKDPLRKTFASLCQILRDPDIRGLVMGEGPLEFNEQTLMPTFNRKPIDETGLTALREAIEVKLKKPGRKGLQFAPADIKSAVRLVAGKMPYHPVREYLKALKWDGEHRLERVAQEIVRADPTPLHITLVRRWIIQAVARALDPGCKADAVLILQGPQKKGKSAFFKVLADGTMDPLEEGWFSDTVIDISDKDAKMLLHRIWIYEWGELEVMQKARDTGAVKAFVVSQIDWFRPPYGAEMMSHKRPSVLGGTCNEKEVLTDPTGNRRYWFVRTTLPVDLDLLATWRDQLWAEAVVAFKEWVAKGRRRPVPWDLTDEEELLLSDSHDEFMRPDAWEDRVQAWLKVNPGPVTVGGLLTMVIDKPMGQWTRSDEMRISAVLKKLGYEKRRCMVEGARSYKWYLGPEAETPF